MSKNKSMEPEENSAANGVKCCELLCPKVHKLQRKYRLNAFNAIGLKEDLEPLLNIIEKAERIRHWHDSANDGMVVGAEAVRDLWEALSDAGVSYMYQHNVKAH